MVWNTCYFYYLYKYPDVYTGSPDTGYLKQTKKQYIVWSLVIAAAIDAVYAYFICVTGTYKNLLNKEESSEGGFGIPSPGGLGSFPGVGGDDEKKDDEKKDDNKEDEKKDDAA